jgi:CHAT domain-containing protein
MARPTKRQETETFEVTVPAALHRALVHLATHTSFGVTENAVAAYILAKEIERMQKADEFGLKMPTG